MTPEQQAEIRRWLIRRQIGDGTGFCPASEILRALDEARDLTARLELANAVAGACAARLATAEAEVARVGGLAEGWRELAADLRVSDKDHHPHDTVQARIFERCAREVDGG